MSHRTNLILSDDAWEMLQQIPKGHRSDAVSQAVVSSLTLRQRRDAAARMDTRRSQKVSAPGTSEEWIREDRDSH